VTAEAAVPLGDAPGWGTLRGAPTRLLAAAQAGAGAQQGGNAAPAIQLLASSLGATAGWWVLQRGADSLDAAWMHERLG
jgi:hypothetical protein